MLMYFKSGSTKMTIDPDKFFPLPMDKLRKFVKVLSQADFPDCVDYLDQVEHYLKDRIQFLKMKRSFYINSYPKDPSDDVDEFYMKLQTESIRKTVDYIVKQQEKLEKNLEYVENR